LETKKNKISDVTLRIFSGYLIVVFTMIMLMIVSDINMARTQEAIKISSNQYVPQMNIASTIKSIVQEQKALVRDFTIGNTNVKQKYRELDRYFRASIRQFEKLESEEVTLQSLYRVEREHDNFKLVANHIFKYAEAGRTSLVSTLWQNYNLAGNKMIVTADQLLLDSNNSVRDAQMRSETILINSRRFMLTIAIITIGACFLLTFITSSNITIPLLKMVDVSKDIAKGNLTNRQFNRRIQRISQVF
jgi:hypothetical protein